jgi:purine-binding chemotaxis protein CheW
MIATQQKKLPFVIFQIKGGLYAVASKNVREIVRMPQVTVVPNAPPEVRGVINLRGKIIKLIDLRVKLGLPPLRAELDALIQLLRDREQDHRNWLVELEACVRERRRFGMARDPHKCKFGLWYDQFKTEDKLLRMTLPSMDAPHKAIHATADVALSRAESGDVDGALGLIASRRNHELGSLVKLFEESRRALVGALCEVAVVLSCGKDLFAFSADLVEAAEHIPEDGIEPMPRLLADLNGGLHCRVGKRPKTNQIILILSDEFFSNSVASPATRQRCAALV